MVISCAFQTNTTRSINDIKTDDLDSLFLEELQLNPNYFYKFEDRHAVDFMVTVVRANTLSSYNTIGLGEILFSLGLIGKEDAFDCDIFYSKLTMQERTIVQSKMLRHPFICNNRQYSEKDALESFPVALSDKINNNRVADSHWAWFSATGDTRALKRILDNYLYNPKACHRCIQWSYQSNAAQNQDVKQYLSDYMDTKSKDEIVRLLSLWPKNALK